MSTTDIRARGCATCTLSCVTYHLGVLVESHLVRRLGAGSVRGRLEHRFAAAIGDRPAVIETLEATAIDDGARPEPTRA